MIVSVSQQSKKNALDDLVDLNFGHPAPPQRTAASLDPWSPNGAAAPPAADPWGGVGGGGGAVMADPWGGAAAAPLSTSPVPNFNPAPVRAADPWGAPALPAQGRHEGILLFNMSEAHLYAITYLYIK